MCDELMRWCACCACQTKWTSGVMSCAVTSGVMRSCAVENGVMTCDVMSEV